MSLARRHKIRLAAAATAHGSPALDPAPAKLSPFPLAGAPDRPRARPIAPAAPAAPQPAPKFTALANEMALRFTHDRRRLKEIKSTAGKVAAKRGMVPEYQPWIDGLLAADAGVGTGTSGEILPTMMVWNIDIGAYATALDLLEFVLRHRAPMPSRYERDAATLAVEELAEIAIKKQVIGQDFPTDILERVDEITAGYDMHDQPRAKLHKALGTAYLDQVENGEITSASATILAQATHHFQQAQSLNDRIGVRDRLKKAARLSAAISAAGEPAAP